MLIHSLSCMIYGPEAPAAQSARKGHCQLYPFNTHLCLQRHLPAGVTQTSPCTLSNNLTEYRLGYSKRSMPLTRRHRTHLIMDVISTDWLGALTSMHKEEENPFSIKITLKMDLCFWSFLQLIGTITQSVPLITVNYVRYT